MCVSAYICKHIFLYVCVYINTFTHLCVSVYTDAQIHPLVCVYTHMYLQVREVRAVTETQ